MKNRQSRANSPKLARRAILLAIVVFALAPLIVMAKDTPKKSSPKPMEIAQGRAGLPKNVAEMRDAIIAAARTGDVRELLVPIQWNELPPDFGDLPISETLSTWQKNSPDGTGREVLALLINLLEAPYAVVRQGPDVENAKIFIWPAFSELPLNQLSPALDVEFLRLVRGADAARMKARNEYDGYGIAIGADGTWHAFKKTRSSNQPTSGTPPK